MRKLMKNSYKKKMFEIFFFKVRKKMFKILGAKNRRKNLHKHPGPPFQIREGPGSFSNATLWACLVASGNPTLDAIYME